MASKRLQWETILSPTRGLDERMPSIMQDRRYTPVLKNMRIEDGVLKKRPGLSVFGNCQFTAPVNHLTQYRKLAGTNRLMAFTAPAVYFYNTTTTGWNPINPGVAVEDCEDAWQEQVVANVTPSTTTDRVAGSNAARFTVAAGFTTGIIGSEAISSANLSTYTAIAFAIKSSVATAAGDIQLLLDNTANCASPLETLDVPALSASQWTLCVVALADAASDTAIISVGLKLATDIGACVIDIDDIWAITKFIGTDSDRFSSDTFNDNLYFSNGVDAVYEWSGSGQASAPTDISGTLTKARVVRAHGSRLNAYYTTESGTAIPQRHRYAAAGGIDFAASGSGFGDYFEGADAIIDAIPLGSRMIVYKDASINTQEHVGGLSVFRRERLVATTGALSKDSVVDTGPAHLFPSVHNLYAFDGSRFPTPIGDAIQRTLYDILNDTYASRATSLYLESLGEVWFFVPTGASTWCDTAFVYNIYDSSWTKLTYTSGISAVGSWTRTNTITWGDLVGTWGQQTWKWGDRQLESLAPIYLLANAAGFIHTIDALANDDEGTAIDCVFDTVDTPLSNSHTRGECRYLSFAFEARGTSVDVLYSTDEGATYTAVETKTLTSSWARYETEVDFLAPRARFSLRQSGTTGTLELRHFEIGYIQRGDIL